MKKSMMFGLLLSGVVRLCMAGESEYANLLEPSAPPTQEMEEDHGSEFMIKITNPSVVTPLKQIYNTQRAGVTKVHLDSALSIFFNTNFQHKNAEKWDKWKRDHASAVAIAKRLQIASKEQHVEKAWVTSQRDKDLLIWLKTKKTVEPNIMECAIKQSSTDFIEGIYSEKSYGFSPFKEYAKKENDKNQRVHLVKAVFDEEHVQDCDGCCCHGISCFHCICSKGLCGVYCCLNGEEFARNMVNKARY